MDKAGSWFLPGLIRVKCQRVKLTIVTKMYSI